MPNKIIWKRSSKNVKQKTLETTASMGSFVGDNYDSVSSLNKEIEMKEQELQKIKQEQSHEMAHHQSEMQELKDGYADQLKQLRE